MHHAPAGIFYDLSSSYMKLDRHLKAEQYFETLKVNERKLYYALGMYVHVSRTE